MNKEKLQDGLNKLQNAITETHKQIKSYIANKENVIKKDVQEKIKQDSDFLDNLKTIVYKTAITDLQFEIEDNVIDIEIIQNDVKLEIEQN